VTRVDGEIEGTAVTPNSAPPVAPVTEAGAAGAVWITVFVAPSDEAAADVVAAVAPVSVISSAAAAATTGRSRDTRDEAVDPDMMVSFSSSRQPAGGPAPG
jgi:hypothetical protein